MMSCWLSVERTHLYCVQVEMKWCKSLEINLLQYTDGSKWFEKLYDIFKVNTFLIYFFKVHFDWIPVHVQVVMEQLMTLRKMFMLICDMKTPQCSCTIRPELRPKRKIIAFNRDEKLYLICSDDVSSPLILPC